MRKSGFGNCFYKSIAIMMVLFSAAACLGGCGPELEQTVGESLVPNGGERRISLEELERTADSEEVEESEEDRMSGEDVWEPPENGGFLCEDARGYDFFMLSESERLWYRDMAQAMGEMAGRIKLSEDGIKAGLDEDRVDKIFQAVLNDHPELFYVEGYNYTKYTRANKTVAIEFTGTYSMDWDAVLQRRREIEAEVGRILSEAPDSEDDYGKIKYAYETLIMETDYDIDAEDNQNIYSVFVGHASVCQGYAKAFQYLMHRMGVECALIQGKVLETGEGHAWNLVKADGDFYYVDATWGDISYQSEERQTEETQDVLPDISYEYLCVTTELLLRTHVPNKEAELPKCTAQKDNYYVREGALFTDYDKEQLAELVERKLEQGSYDISLRCADENCYKTMCEALLDHQEIFDYLAGTGINSFVYTSSERQLTLTFFMMTNKR